MTPRIKSETTRADEYDIEIYARQLRAGRELPTNSIVTRNRVETALAKAVIWGGVATGAFQRAVKAQVGRDQVFLVACAETLEDERKIRRKIQEALECVFTPSS